MYTKENSSIIKVSVCMITYGHEKYIREAIYGVLMQECDFEVELILSNDYSPDKTDEVVQNIIANHPRGNWIKYFNHEHNLGMMSNLTFALQQCRGEYIAFCEGDDYWIDCYKLKKQYDILNNNPIYNFCITNLNFLHNCTKKIEEGIMNTNQKPIYTDIRSFLVNRGFMAPCTWFGKRECFFYTDLAEIESDATFAIFLDVLQTTEVYFLNEVTTVYRILPESGSRSNSLLFMYNYYKCLYNTQITYINKYNLLDIKDLVDRNHLAIMTKLLKLYPNSPDLFDVLIFYKNDFPSENLLNVTEDLIRYHRKKIDQLNNSKSMTIGRFFTRPYIYLGKLLKSK